MINVTLDLETKGLNIDNYDSEGSYKTTIIQSIVSAIIIMDNYHLDSL